MLFIYLYASEHIGLYLAVGDHFVFSSIFFCCCCSVNLFLRVVFYLTFPFLLVVLDPVLIPELLHINKCLCMLFTFI